MAARATISNDTIFGLNTVVFTHDAERALHVARRLRAGLVGHNASRTDFSIGFGGFKQSSAGGLEAFLEVKTVVPGPPAE
ncbi:aldehyde dehydrogenase family protein [Burkholderia sp. BCC1644]|uniref:aldehyde dehydrogenase family protein n=1 Tax=Burkholderia sp. BCC1644 TaxID=2676293 RepID=UPI00158FDB8B|nr:aldehyde dehydrogenase family protein [Burkholderia sp. BCC1644]